jgi:hypothetical protein
MLRGRNVAMVVEKLRLPARPGWALPRSLPRGIRALVRTHAFRLAAL